MVKARQPPSVNITTIRTAELLIERHGDEAVKFAEAQAARLASAGSEASSTDWRGVILAIKQLQQQDKKRGK